MACGGQVFHSVGKAAVAVAFFKICIGLSVFHFCFIDTVICFNETTPQGMSRLSDG